MSLDITYNTVVSRSPNTAAPPPPVNRPPPNTAADFWLYTTPFTAVFQYRRFYASPESGIIGGRLIVLEMWQLAP